MSGLPRHLSRAAVLVALLAAPIAAHVAVVTERGVAVAGALVAVQAGLIAWISLSLALPKVASWWRGLAAVAVAALTGWIWHAHADGLVLAAAVPHAISFAGLLAFFACSLAPEREPVISVVARRARGDLSPALQAYTRSVTVAWCIFFAAQLAISLLLWLAAPLQWWSAFVTVGTWPSVALMFAVELAWRRRLHGICAPSVGSGRLAHVGQVLAQLRGAVTSPTPQTRP